MKTNENHLAYPHNLANSVGDVDRGLTKLELFSAMAMQGLLASNAFNTYHYETYAGHSVTMAKALINELNKQNENK